MFVPIWLIVLNALIILVLAALAFRSGRTEDMIERQRRRTPPPKLPPAGGEAPVSETQLHAEPEIRRALEAGKSLEAIKLVRRRTGWGLKEAKDWVDRQRRRA